MRWSGLVIDEQDPVVRTFDTPGFAGMTFYEIRAKSILNRVPAGTGLPFEWTLNPYRGCSHACVYCLSGDTPILLADGRPKPLAELAVGERIYGTVRQGRDRRYVPTEVLAHWSTVKPAYRVVLADGTQLISSADHRFLTGRGWRHVTAGMAGAGRRPHLTPGDELVGTGQFAAPPKHTDDYLRGYLCGMIRGDAHPGSYSYQRPGRSRGDVHRFRPALVDEQAVRRTRSYLTRFGIETDESASAAPNGPRTALPAIRTSRRDRVAAIQRLIAWPESTTGPWRQGFLAGSFDAGGTHGDAIRITSGDREIIDRTAMAMQAFGFSYAVEITGNHRWNVRLVGGLRERLRFLHTVDPAITRKRTIDGTALQPDADLRVISVEELGFELPLYDITTGTGDFIADGVVSHNCFARSSHTYLDLDAGADFDRRVVVKVNAGELLRRELAAPRWGGHPVAMGTNVDCYQRAEGKYRLMPQILAALRDFANPFSILTKGTLLLRDLDLLRQAAAVTDVRLAVSIGFLDEAVWRAVEPGTPSPARRLDLVRALTAAGFRVGVLMAPILPGLTDGDDSVRATVAAIARAGAASLTPIPLHLRPGAREWYGKWLAAERPDLVGHYRALYARGAYPPKAYQRELVARVRDAARRYGIGDGSGAGDHRQSPAPGRRPAAAPAEQPTLW